MNWVIESPESVGVSVAYGGRFPVRHVWCVGRNYAAHAREMEAEASPLFFAKPAHAVTSAARVPYPPLTSELHHEVELVAALAGGGRELTPDQAAEIVYGYAVGVDLTRRDVQREAKQNRHPWDMAKGFDHSAPTGAIVPADADFSPDNSTIELDVNGQNRQRGELAQMIWPVPDLLAELSRHVRLSPGDLIFTGTPAGVAPLEIGDRVSARIRGLPELAFDITEE